ncbi:allantoinase [Paenibacillus sp. NPDC058071]|uniref:allantoinase n=1 Tax=Paenibacillus sp. NPDC058071 TaxID=3346326 RepID=UPI0036D885B9
MTNEAAITLFKNGTVVLKDRTAAVDVAVRDGQIIAIGSGLAEEAVSVEVVDATGLTIMPGMVDAHVHLNEPGLGDWEGFETGSAALAAGGCTTYIDMPLNGIPPTVTLDALKMKQEAAIGRSSVDYAIWGGLVPGKLDYIESLHEAGVIGFKAFMSSPGDPSEDAFREVDDYTLYEGMKRIAAVGKVLALHAESEPIVSKLSAEMLREGRTTAADYVASRPILAELEAVNRALFYAEQTGCALHFVHISSEAGVRAIMAAKARGIDVTVETCPHFLKLTSDSMTEKGASAKCAPPLRSEEEREKLWQAVAAGNIDIIASDHSPCPEELKRGAHFFEVWGGIAGAQNSLELIVGEGHVKRRLPLPLLAGMLSSGPAERFGLADRKGEIRVGADADFAIVDLKRTYTLTKEQLLHKHKHNPYIGEEMHCKVVATYVRGIKVYDEEAGLSAAKEGKWMGYRETGR